MRGAAREAKGATDLNFAPPFDELWAVFLPTLARFGVSAQPRRRPPHGRPEFEMVGGGNIFNNYNHTSSTLNRADTIRGKYTQFIKPYFFKTF